MEAIFENTCYYNKKNLLGMNRKTLKKGFVIYCVVFIWLFLIAGIVSLLCFEQVGIIIFAIFLFGALFLGYRLYSTPQKAVNITYKRYFELYHCEVETHTSFFEDHFLGINVQSKGKIELQYERIVCIKETENLLLLILPENLVIMVDKSGFNVGTLEAFINFIRLKCSNAKFKLKSLKN